jgi:5-methylthioadenosine/S-adenosylhomocysteine deaminase
MGTQMQPNAATDGSAGSPGEQRLRSTRVLLTAVDGYRITPATVVLRKDRITEVLPHEPPQQGDDDLGERLLAPAFVDAHTHLALCFMRGVDTRRVRANLVEDLYFHFESRLSPGDVRAFARMGAYESLLNGVGFVWDHYYAGLEVADALRETGLCGAVAPTVQDLAGPGKNQSERALRDTLDLAHSSAYQGSGIVAALGPHATDTVSPALLRRIAELAESEQLPVHLHVAQSVDELRRVEAREGRSPMALLQREGVLTRPPHVLMAHAIYASMADLQGLVADRHTLAFCPSSQAQFAMPASLPHFERAGVRWAVASDCASSNDSMNLQKELRACVLAGATHATYHFAYASFMETGRFAEAEAAAEARLEGATELRAGLQVERLLSRVLELPGSMHPHLAVGRIAPGSLANLVCWDLSHPAFFPAVDPLRGLCLGDTAGAMYALWTRGQEHGTRGDVARSIVQSDAYRENQAEARARLTCLLA